MSPFIPVTEERFATPAQVSLQLKPNGVSVVEV